MTTPQKILIVDDEPSSIRLIQRLLKKKNYRTEAASSGEEALKVINSYRPDLVLLDINMTGIDGYETCRRIRANDDLRSTKVILITGRAELDERLKGYQAGADDYMAKPFSTAELKAKIEVFTKLKRSEEVDKAKSDLMTLFSHETRTPLGAIIGLAELIKDNETLDPQTIHCADLIMRSANDLHRFVEKTLLLLQLKGGLSLHREIGLIEEHLDEKLQSLESLRQKKSITINREHNAREPILADWSMIGRAIGYILDNAIKFSDEGGEITTRTFIDNNSYKIEISDKGKGIEPSWIDKIFNEFAIQDIEHHQQGQGLSMAITKHIVELHNGTIAVESTLGEGTLFSIDLPME